MTQIPPQKPLKSLLTLNDKFKIVVLLIDDQPIIEESIRRMLDDQKDIHLYYCHDPLKAIEMANEIKPTVILQDLVMPEIEGLVLVRYFRVNPQTRDVPIIVLSSKEEPIIKAEAFSVGANDYIVKLPDSIELIARIRHHSASYIRLLERNEAYQKIEESQRLLNAELAEAANYVISLLPPPISIGHIKTDWRFLPSTKLGGDAFGYYDLDDDHFVMFLLDVCGHGVGAALLSISIVNVLRSQTLQADFFKPEEVLTALNRSFPMEEHNGMFFTIWYGVYCKSQNKLSYSSGAHPPAILLTEVDQNIHLQLLHTEGTIIGGMEGMKFNQAECDIIKGSKLYIFSDGLYELEQENGEVLSYETYSNHFKKLNSHNDESLDQLINFSKSIMNESSFADDLSILEIIFN